MNPVSSVVDESLIVEILPPLALLLQVAALEEPHRFWEVLCIVHLKLHVLLHKALGKVHGLPKGRVLLHKVHEVPACGLLVQAKRVGGSALELVPRVGHVVVRGILAIVQHNVHVQSSHVVHAHDAAVVCIRQVGIVFFEVGNAERGRDAALGPGVCVGIRPAHKNGRVCVCVLVCVCVCVCVGWLVGWFEFESLLWDKDG